MHADQSSQATSCAASAVSRCERPLKFARLSHETPAIVLDTNAVLDWLWFGDPAMTPVAKAITSGRCCWLRTAAMRAELEHVVAHKLPDRPGARRHQVVDDGHRWACEVEAPAPFMPGAALACRDADDQMFIDLALAQGARWLLSRDRAVLALARRARTMGLAIVPPRRWVPDT